MVGVVGVVGVVGMVGVVGVVGVVYSARISIHEQMDTVATHTHQPPDKAAATATHPPATRGPIMVLEGMRVWL